jgi:hypothetical protein
MVSVSYDGPFGRVIHVPEVDQVVDAGDELPEYVGLYTFLDADGEEAKTVAIIAVDKHGCSPFLSLFSPSFYCPVNPAGRTGFFICISFGLLKPSEYYQAISLPTIWTSLLVRFRKDMWCWSAAYGVGDA